MSGMIYAVIVVMWAAFLVPMWLRRHDENAEAKSVDKFASKMRVLARRTDEAEPADSRVWQRPARGATSAATSRATIPARAATSVPAGTVSSTVRIVGRESSTADRPTADRPSIERPAAEAVGPAARAVPASPEGGSAPDTATARRRAFRDTWADDADVAALAALAAPDLARDLARDRGLGHAPASLAGRRRRVLAVLAGTTFLLAVLAALSVAPWLLAGLTGAAAAAYVVHLRVQAKRTAEIARRRTRAARTRPDAPQASRTATVPTARGRVPQAVPAEEADPEEGWQPVSVPVPTYVTAPRAGRAIRRIDLRGDDAWTSGRLVADAAAAGKAAAAAAHQESVGSREADTVPVQRAVGD